jgi:hypothetical protein
VVTRIGFRRETAHSIIDNLNSIPFQIFLLILSIIIIASFTTIPISEINHTQTGIDIGFHVIYNPNITQINDIKTEYRITAGCP